MPLTYILGIESYDCRTIQVGKHLVKSLVQLAASQIWLLRSARVWSCYIQPDLKNHHCFTIFLGNPLHRFTVLLGISFSLYPTWMSPSPTYVHCFSSSHHTQLWGASAHLLADIPAGTGGLLLGSPLQPPLLQTGQCLMSQPLLTRQVLQTNTDPVIPPVSINGQPMPIKPNHSTTCFTLILH